MRAEEIAELINDMRHEVIQDMVSRFIPEKAYPEQWEMQSLHTEVHRVLALDLPTEDWAEEEGIADAEILERLTATSDEWMAEKETRFTSEVMRMAEKSQIGRASCRERA